MALCLVPSKSWITIINTDSIFIKDSINLHVNGAFVTAKRHLVTIKQLSDWPAVIYGSSDQLLVFWLVYARFLYARYFVYARDC